MNKKIVIGIALKNGKKTIRRNILSIMNQLRINFDNVIILVIDDDSSDNWKEEIKDLNINNLIIKNVNLGKVYKVRNYILDYVDSYFSRDTYILRLDSDDYLVDNMVLSKIKYIIEKKNPDVIISGNKLSYNNIVIKKENYAGNYLLDNSLLLKILENMSKGISDNELPSCNTIVRAKLEERYPEQISAEDHWYLIDLLKKKNEYNIYIASNLLLTTYSLSGNSTKKNILESIYYKSRKELYLDYLNFLNGGDFYDKKR